MSIIPFCASTTVFTIEEKVACLEILGLSNINMVGSSSKSVLE